MHDTDRLPEIPLGLAQVVRLGELLARQRLVGDLGLGAPRVGVVGQRALGGPLQEPGASSPGGALELLAEHLVPLGVDDDRPVSVLDQPRGDPRLGDGLAGAGRAHHQRVRSRALTDGDPGASPVQPASNRQPAAADPALAAGPAQETPVRWDPGETRAAGRDLGMVATGGDVGVVPAGALQRSEHRDEPDREPSDRGRARELSDRQAEQRPGPRQPPSAKRPREQPTGAEDDAQHDEQAFESLFNDRHGAPARARQRPARWCPAPARL